MIQDIFLENITYSEGITNGNGKFWRHTFFLASTDFITFNIITLLLEMLIFSSYILVMDYVVYLWQLYSLYGPGLLVRYMFK